MADIYGDSFEGFDKAAKNLEAAANRATRQTERLAGTAESAEREVRRSTARTAGAAGSAAGAAARGAAGGGAVAGGGGAGQGLTPKEMNALLSETHRNATRAAGSMSYYAASTEAASQNMRRHGALTTEWIQTAARGDTTLRELGWQVSSTIGKFGGWTLAAGLVFGTLRAVQRLREGVVAADEAVVELGRVVDGLDRGTALSTFSDLASEFNLPISEVGGAAFEMGKIFGDQNKTFEATRAILYSVKAGNMDYATSARYLTSIIQGFNLDASDMGIVFDQINQAQNEFGVNIENTQSGMARASGTFRAAGGDLSYLLALISTGQRVTGQTGDVIGTALGRAPNFLRQASSQAILESFGIDATQDIDRVMDQAFKAARSLTGQRLQEMSAAIFGPQYGARLGNALFQNEELFRRVQAGTSPEASRGSAAEELEQTLSSVREQTARVGVELEQLGASLVQSGLVDGFALALASLNQLLSTANSLLSVFNELPGGLKRGLSYALQLGLAMKLLSRFRVGQEWGPDANRPGQPPVGGARGFIGGVFGGRTAGGYTARNVRQGLGDELVQLQDNRAKLATDVASAHRREAAWWNQANAEGQRAAQAMGRNQDEHVRALRAHEYAKQKAIGYEQRRTDAEVEIADNVRRQAEVGRGIERSRRTFGQRFIPGARAAADQRALEYARGTQMAGLPTSERPTLIAPRPLVPQGQLFATDAKGQAVPEQLTLMQTGAVEETQKAIRTAQDQGARDAHRQGVAAQNQIRSGAQRFGLVVNKFLGAAGTLMFAGFIGSMLAQSLRSVFESVGERAEAVSQAVASNEQELQQELQRISAEVDAGAGLEEIITDVFSTMMEGPQHVLSQLPQLLAKGLADATSALEVLPEGKALSFLPGKLSELLGDPKSEAAELRRSIAESEQANRDLQQRVTRRETAYGRPAPFRFVKDIEEDVKELRNSAQSRGETLRGLRHFDQELESSLENLGQAEGSTEEQRKSVRDAQRKIRIYIANLAQGGGARFAERIATIGDEGLAEVTATAQRELTGPLGFNEGAANRLALTYQQVVRRFAADRSPEAVEKLIEEREAFHSSMEQAISAELDAALGLARSPADRKQAFAAAYQRVAKMVEPSREALGEQRDRVMQTRNRLTQTSRQLERLPSQAEAIGGIANIFGGPEGVVEGLVSGAQLAQRKRLQERQRELLDRLKKDSAQYEAVKERFRENRACARQLRAQIQRQEFDLEQAVAQSRLQAELVFVGDSRIKAARTAQAAAERMRAVANQPGMGRGSQEWWDAVASYRQAQADEASEHLEMFQLEQQLRVARMPQEQQTRGRLDAARAYLQRLRAMGTRADPKAIYNTLIEIANLSQQIQEEEATKAEEEAKEIEDLRLARFDVRIARAEAQANHVRAARAELRRSQYVYRQAETPVERVQARADIIRKRANLRQTMLDRETDDIEFRLDMERITNNEAIGQYRRLMSTMELNRDQRRQILRRIQALKREAEGAAGDFELRVGDIRLPTVYDVRRAMQARGVNQRSVMQQNNRVEINVNGGGVDVRSAVAQAIDDTLNTSTRSQMRSAGVL